MANNKKRRPKGNYKPNSANKDRYDDRRRNKAPRVKDEDVEVSTHTNDLRWYVPDESSLNNVATYAFGQPLGTINQLFEPDSGNNYDSTWVNGETAPGICALNVHPAVGISDGLTAPINIAAQDMYTNIRAYNSGSKNYDKTDLMIRCIAIDQVFSLYGYLCRTYAACMRYTALNTYWAEPVVTATGANYGSLIGTMADFREFINLTANRINTLVVPSTLPLFERHMYLYTTFFKDAPTIKSQLYLFKPTGFYLYDEFTNPSGGQLVFRPLPINWTLATMKTYVNNFIESLIESEDIAVMTGDILKAYGANVFRVSQISPDYMVEPVYDEVVLSQIHNARFMNIVTGTDSIVQNNEEGDPRCGAILFNPTFWSNLPIDCRWIIDTKVDIPSAGLVMESTRLTPMAQDSEWNGTTPRWESTSVTCGTEILTGADIYYFMRDDDFKRLASQHFSDTAEFTADGESTASVITALHSAITTCAHLEKFAWHPEVIPYISSSSNPNRILPGLRDLDNFIPMDYDDLHRMHTRAVFTEFGLPNVRGFKG